MYFKIFLISIMITNFHNILYVVSEDDADKKTNSLSLLLKFLSSFGLSRDWLSKIRDEGLDRWKKHKEKMKMVKGIPSYSYHLYHGL